MSKRDLLSVLFFKHQLELRSFISRMFSASDPAEDIVQDTFHKLLSMEEGIDSIENPRAYLYKTAKNLALNNLRKGRYHSEYVASLDVNEAAAPCLFREISSKQDLKRIQEAIASMPNSHKEVFLLNRESGLSYAQIAQKLGVSVSTIEKRMMKVLKLLYVALEEGEK